VIKGLIGGTPAGLERVRQFLVGEKLDAHALTDRSAALVRAVRETPEGKDPQLFLAMANRIGEIAVAALQNGTITRVVIDKNYRPSPSDLAWKFGLSDAETPPGFEMITPSDSRLKGPNMRGVHRPGKDAMTTSGIVGIRSFQGIVPDGDWHVMLLTDDLGEPGTSLAPLGQSLAVNATHVDVNVTDPSNWLDRAYLTNKRIEKPKEAEGPLKPIAPNDVVAHQAPPTDQENKAPALSLPDDDIASTSAGALAVNAKVTGGQLAITFTPPTDRNDQDTYLIAIIVEPGNQPSALQPEISNLDVLATIFNEAVALTEPPTAGQPLANQLQFLPTAGDQGNTTLDVVAPSAATSSASPT
jgi:hypothetical protein